MIISSCPNTIKSSRLLILSGGVLNVDGDGGNCGGIDGGDSEKQNFCQRGEEEPLVPQGPGPGATKLSDR